jgi:hypothetical protein
MNVQRAGSARENVLNLTTQALEDFVVLARDPDFDCRFLDRPLLQFPKEHTRFGRGQCKLGAQRLYQPRRGFRRRRRDQQLRIILVRQLWIHIVVEAWSAGSHERGVVSRPNEKFRFEPSRKFLLTAIRLENGTNRDAPKGTR